MSNNPATAGTSTNTQVIDQGLLGILVCPLTRSPLTLEGQELVSQVGCLRYPVREGIPIMLISEAKLPDDVKTLDEFKAKYVK